MDGHDPKCATFRALPNYTLRDLSRIAEFFDVSLDYLVGRSNEQKGNKR